jgi:hypothetical protein
VATGNEAINPDELATAHGQGDGGRMVTHVMPSDLMNQWLTAANAPILTDDYAPVDNLIAPVFAERGF